MKIDFKGKKIAFEGDILYGFIKKEITALGGIFLENDAKIKEVDMFIVAYDYINSDLAVFLQHSKIEFYFMDEIIASIGSDYYPKLKKLDKERFFMGCIFSDCKGKFKGIEKELKDEIRKAIADPNQFIQECTYSRVERSRREFKDNSKYKIGDKLPAIKPYGKNTPENKEIYELYTSVNQFRIISTSMANPKLTVGEMLPVEIYNIRIGEDPLVDIEAIDRIYKIPTDTDLFQKSNQSYAKNLIDKEEAKELGINLKDTFFFYYQNFTSYNPVLLSILDNSFVVLNGDDHGALFETSGEKYSFADILPYEIYRTDEERETYLNRIEEYNSEKAKQENITKINKYAEKLLNEEVSKLY